MRNKVELKDFIRFQLAQLGAKNGEHQFELLSFELARCRHVSNLIPATGPVKAGGDQGRDFESYSTFLNHSVAKPSSFIALVSDVLVVGACTLNKRTGTKIKDDLKTIFSGETKPGKVIYFCEPNIPVSKRHQLIEECQKEYQAKLEIFDGQAISDQLSDPDTFWIAQQFLSIPAEYYPQFEVDKRYEHLKSTWIEKRKSIGNYADFISLKLGLRTATWEEYAKPDIIFWLTKMRKASCELFDPALRQKARYEVIVAELRGRGSLDPASQELDEFLNSLMLFGSDLSPVVDASVIAVYTWGAYLNGATLIGIDRVRDCVEKVTTFVDSVDNTTARKIDACLIAEARALLSAIPRSGLSIQQIAKIIIKSWRTFLQEAEKVQYYPIKHVDPIIEHLAPFMEKSRDFREVRKIIDRLFSERGSKIELANTAKKRAERHIGKCSTRSGSRPVIDGSVAGAVWS